jgi:excisionase family DNA binding protein|nr:MAG TPA: helix-turn-helix domain protein [Caudoviricetes sp.]
MYLLKTNGIKKMKEEIIPDDTDRLLSVEEVAERLRTGKQFVRRLINAGLLPALSFRRNRRIRKVSLNKFLEEYDGKDLYEVLEGK